MANQTLECTECGKTESSFVNPFLQHANGADYEPAIHYLCNADRQARRQTRAAFIKEILGVKKVA